MTYDAPYKRLLRRESHSPRSTLAIVLAIVGIVACLYAATEIVLHLLGVAPLLAAPADIAAAIASISSVETWLLVVAGAVVALIGLWLVIVAIAPGRRARHRLVTERSAVVVDDEVIASALARTASRAALVSPDGVRASVSRRSAVVTMTPRSGQPIDRAAAAEAVQRELDESGLAPTLRSRTTIEKRGVVGA
ncbi:DUF6286 domain-containing protein [Herbiconiux daphne]|uniref:DUF6286 domain-containing protein n=1 Tax=Herbiconiux daphne TaxID=2970914 RepID=A0ABT2H3V8_9MICO|nr:DUF6286 domain-containing protein [Herbiconiux daphne]MCS5734591.1 DUF6286 domain-containing protein [Herbiconiux daphne]